jgi:membrane protein implicated in regulation of membrane protease activity
MGIGFIYFLCFLVGFVYAVITGALGHIFGSGSDVHMDASGHIGFEGGEVGLSVASPTLIAAFLSGFGGTGLVVHNLYHPGTGVSLLVSTLGGLVISGGAYALLGFLYQKTQAGSEFRDEQVVGKSAEVTLAIPEGGVGEIAFSVKGSRSIASARAEDGKAIPRHTTVKITKSVAGTFYVKREA